ncbi:MAG: carboxypeptidase regulatory-like domain-containing protein, partial [Acidobacteriaceae bacterium]|nr:carboxypeptidase regulatory-like domain-containing protein [Acidobacteriaceae bacterium]
MRIKYALLTLLSAAMLIGQADRGVITGLVTDAQGAAIPNATVQIKDAGTGVVTSVKTTSEGNYSTPPLVIGSYEVS